MTKMNCSLILSIALLGCMLVSSPLYGQSESALKEFFEGKTVVVRIRMPGSYHGVDVYPKRAEPIDWKEHSSELKKYGTAIPRFREVRITEIKTKSKHIEFQLDGGGWSLANQVAVVANKVAGVADEVAREVFPPPKSQREIKLEERSESGRRLSYGEEQELKKLQRPEERRRLAEKDRIAREKPKRKAGGSRSNSGSRFNIRYESKLTDGDMKPESVMAVLSRYVDFSPDASKRVQVSRRLYPKDESHLDSSFAEFKAKLLQAIETQDREFLRSALAPNMRLFHEPAAPLDFAMETFDRDEGALWKVLHRMLSMGVKRLSDGRFYAPYVSYVIGLEMEDFDDRTNMVITDKDVVVYAEPKPNASIIAVLSYNILEFDRDKSSADWFNITIPDWQDGYVSEKYGYTTDSHRAVFAKQDGEWKLTHMQAGD